MSCLLTRLRCATQNGTSAGSLAPLIYSTAMQRNSSFVCSYCNGIQIIFRGPVTFHNVQSRSSTTYTRLRELLMASKHKRRRPRPRYVELLQVSSNSKSPITESVASVKKSTATKVLQKLGVTSAPSQKINSKKAFITEEFSKSNSSYKTKCYSSSGSASMTKVGLPRPNVPSPKYESSVVANMERVKNYERKVFPVDILSAHSVQMPNDILWKDIDNHAEVGEIEDYASTPHFDAAEGVNYSVDPLPHTDTSLPVIEPTEKKAVPSKRAKRRVTSKVINNKHVSSQSTKDLDAAARFSRLEFSLASYLDVCINSNMLRLANDTLLKFQKRTRTTKSQQLFSIRLYNMVLQGWANEGNWVRVHQLLEKMNTIGLKPNLRSYAAALECIGRLTEKKPSLVNLILKKIDMNGLDIKNIFSAGTFVRDQKEIVLKVIRSRLPAFHPRLPEIPTGYNCDLLRNLNIDSYENRHYSPGGLAVSLNELEQAAKSQMDLELQSQVSIKSIQKKKPAMEQTEAWRKVLSGCEEDWLKKLSETFSFHVDNIDQFSDKYGLNLYPYLKALDSKVYVKLMLQEVSNLGQLSEAFSPFLSTLQRNLGVKIMERYRLKKKQKDGYLDKLHLLYGKFCAYYTDPSLTSKYIPRQYWEKLLTDNWLGHDLVAKDPLWPIHILSGVGKFLYDIIIKNVKIDTNVFKGMQKPHLSPAFYTIYRRHDTVKICEEIKPHPLLVKLYQRANKEELIFDASILPMLSPPLPWSSLHSGGFLLSSAQLVRYPLDASSHQKAWLEHIPNKQLYPVFDSLNQLSECSWVINKPILDLVIEVFNNKGSVELDIPQPVSECALLPKVKSGMTKREIAEVMQARSSLKQKKAEMHSLWCDMLYKLSIANQYRDEVIWFPHNLDFRGRVYPCPPHFNHLGSDISRSLLMFAKGEPLGKIGLNWLKIHVINLTGLKKRAPLVERLAFCNEVMSDIMDSADHPLTGRKWWIQSDEPWQTLACCMELTKALRSPDPHAYICQFPVHQDGSCNGLQHYAALGCDEQGAKQVNLLPQNSPQDVYSGIAELVEQERAKDAAEGLKIAQVLEGFVSRRVVKQPVMTTVYGVTRFGARLQIIRQLKDLPGFPQEYKWQAAAYLVGKTFFSLQEMFSSTKHIQDWFTQCATLISQERGEPVQWVTPLGFPIVQPYFRHIKLLKKHCDKRTSTTHTVPNTRKQKNAFPPNYIHSLDSTHMMLTALFCNRAGITFVSVHDCFWTHPSSVDVMNKICREQFVSLHSQPLLQTLSEYFITKYLCRESKEKSGSKPSVNKEILTRVLLSVPPKGSFDLKQVLLSTYFFS